MTTFRILSRTLGTRRGPPLIRGPQFENRSNIRQRAFYFLEA